MMLHLREHPANAVRDYFGTLRAELCISATICSHFVIAVQKTAIKKALILQGFFGRSGEI